MDHDEARTLTLDLTAEHGLTGWRFRWSRGKRTLGSCNYTTKTISLSGYYVELNDLDHVRDTILHEIAHAIAGPQAGHGPKWKAICRRIGADPTRLDHTATMPNSPYEVYCPGCDRVVARRYRRMQREHLERLACGRCGRLSLGCLVFRQSKESMQVQR